MMTMASSISSFCLTETMLSRHRTRIHRLFSCWFLFLYIVAQSTQFGGAFSPTCTSSISRSAVRGSRCNSSIQRIAGNGNENGILKERRRHFLTASSSTDGEQEGPPKYNENHLARDVFSNAYFYGNDKDFAKYTSKKRLKIFGNMTLRDARFKWTTVEEQGNVAESIGASHKKVIAALIPELVEDRLHIQNIFAINGHAEIDAIKRKHVTGVPSAGDAVGSLPIKPSDLLKEAIKKVLAEHFPVVSSTNATSDSLSTKHISQTLTDTLANILTEHFPDVPSAGTTVDSLSTRPSALLLRTVEKRLTGYYPDGPTAGAAIALLSITRESIQTDRARQIILVMGPSGSGKTFFAAKEVATHEVGQAKQVTLYVQPNSIEDYNKDEPENIPLMQGILMKYIQDELTIFFGYVPEQKLDMHVTIVLDEIQRNDYFDNETQPLISFYDKHLVHFAKSVRLVACGTGLTGENLGTNVDCYKIHLKKWSRADVTAVLVGKKGRILTENQDYILDAIFDHSVLKALTTNARTAGYLMEEVSHFDSRVTGSKVKRRNISQHLNSAAPHILETVVNHYTSMNGLQGLNAEARRRVAAFAFGAVENGKDKSKLEPPNLKGLSRKEAAVAWSLLDHNIEYSSVKERPTRLVRSNERPILVSPAISAVLYSMLGSTATIYTSWKGQEQISALYAFRQEVLKSHERFRSNLENGLTDFDSDLAKLDLVLIHEQVPRGGNLTSFILPRFTKNIIWINGERASFADVIAPYMLIQCKHTSNVGKKIDVNLFNEMKKCGLLRNNRGADKSWISGQVALRAIWRMWSDEYVENHDIDLNYSGEKKEDFAVSDEMQQKSLAFPENALVNPNIGNKVESVTVSTDNGNWYIMNGSVSDEVPELSDLVKPGEPRVSFVISTNASRLVVKDKLGKKVCELCMDDIHEDGHVNLDLLAKRTEKAAWLKFEAKIVDGVDIKFLFT